MEYFPRRFHTLFRTYGLETNGLHAYSSTTSNVVFSRECQKISSGPDRDSSDGRTRTECASKRQRGRIAREHDMEHWAEGVPRVGRHPIGYAIRLSKSFFFLWLLMDTKIYARYYGNADKK